jgi:hypothetical protein
VASINVEEIEPNIYYIPKKKKEPVPAVNIGDERRVAETEEFSLKGEPNKGIFDESNPESLTREPISFAKPAADSRKQRTRSSSSSRPPPPIKSFVLPILM